MRTSTHILVLRATGAILGAVAIVSVLAACATSWTEADLVGTWVHTNEVGQSATIELSSDGSAVVIDVPTDSMFGPDVSVADVDWSAVVNGEGTWSMDKFGALVLTIDDESTGRRFGPKIFVDDLSNPIELYTMPNPSDIDVFRYERQ